MGQELEKAARRAAILLVEIKFDVLLLCVLNIIVRFNMSIKSMVACHHFDVKFHSANVTGLFRRIKTNMPLNSTNLELSA